MPQEAFLFTGTVRDNIAYGRPEATDAEVEAAARAVGAHEFIAALPAGTCHELSERGRSLSAGQRQLIALARAELVDPAILLLDEATSNLDLATEARVAAAMHQVSRGRTTTVLIAHRLQTARPRPHRRARRRPGSRSRNPRRAARPRRWYASMWQAFEVVRGPAGASPRRGSNRDTSSAVARSNHGRLAGREPAQHLVEIPQWYRHAPCGRCACLGVKEDGRPGVGNDRVDVVLDDRKARGPRPSRSIAARYPRQRAGCGHNRRARRCCSAARSGPHPTSRRR